MEHVKHVIAPDDIKEVYTVEWPTNRLVIRLREGDLAIASGDPGLDIVERAILDELLERYEVHTC